MTFQSRGNTPIISCISAVSTNQYIYIYIMACLGPPFFTDLLKGKGQQDAKISERPLRRPPPNPFCFFSSFRWGLFGSEPGLEPGLGSRGLRAGGVLGALAQPAEPREAHGAGCPERDRTRGRLGRFRDRGAEGFPGVQRAWCCFSLSLKEGAWACSDSFWPMLRVKSKVVGHEPFE